MAPAPVFHYLRCTVGHSCCSRRGAEVVGWRCWHAATPETKPKLQRQTIDREAFEGLDVGVVILSRAPKQTFEKLAP